jgi:peptidoglycan hydrolase CwlO-like protein
MTHIPVKRHSSRWLAAAVSSFVLMSFALPAIAADTEQQLADARGQLGALETQLQTDRQAVSSLEAQLASIQDEVQQAEARYQELDVKLEQTRNKADSADAHYDVVHDQLNQIMREAYMGGVAGTIGFIMDAESQSDLADRLDFLSAIASANANLAAQVTQLQTDLVDRSASMEQLLKDKEQVLQSLADDRASMQAAAQQHRDALAQEEKTMSNILDLVAELRQELNAADIASLQHTFQGEKSVPYGQWADAFLVNELNAPTCRDNEIAMVAWQLNEGTSADWNPLATTYTMPGGATFNSSGVKNYTSLQQGLDATRLTLEKGSPTYLYQPIIANLRRCSPAMRTAEAINASSWCRGCTYGRYVTGLIEKVAANYNAYAQL